SGIHDAHIHTSRNGVVKKCGVHGFANLVVAAKTEGDIGDAAAYFGVRQIFLDPAGRVDEVDCVVVVLLHPGGDREDVGIEDDVFGRESDAVDQDSISTFTDTDLVFERGGLALFVEGHHDNRGAVSQHRRCIFPELLFAFFKRDGVYDAFALHAFKAGFDDLPLGGVHHERHLGDFRFGCQQLQKAAHGGDAIDHALVHADVDNVGAIFDLLTRDAYRLFVL